LYEVGCGGEGDGVVSFAAGVEFVVGTGVDFGGDGEGAGFCAGFEVSGEGERCEEAVGGCGAGGADAD